MFVAKKPECKNWGNANLLKMTAKIAIFNVYVVLKYALNIYINLYQNVWISY